MSNFAYLLFELVVLFVSVGTLTAYHLIKERSDLMEFSIKVPSKIEKNGNLLFVFFFLLTEVLFYFFNENELVFKEKFLCKVLVLIGAYFSFGFLIFKNRYLCFCKGCVEFIILFLTVGFLNLSMNIKIQMYLILGLFLIFKQPNAQKKYEFPVYCQMITISFTMLMTSFFLSDHLKSIMQIGGTVFPILFVVLPFQKIFQISIRLNQYFINLFQSFFLAIALYLGMEGNVGACFVLLSYPLFEMCFAFFLKVYNFCKRQEAPSFMMDILELAGCSDFDKGMFVFRRNLLFGGLFLFIMYVPDWQPQLVLLTFLLYLKFAVSYVAGPNSNASFRYLFKEMKSDFKKSISETEQAWNVIKQKRSRN